MQKEQDAFLTSVTDHWNPKTTIKDLGPDILYLVPDPTNNGRWENADGSRFPELDDELAPAETAGDF